MQKDLLLSQFEEFELPQAEQQMIKGGRLQINGCSQSGGNSYVDYIGNDGQQNCGAKVGSNDSSTWCSGMTF